jgi:hypothetical protein
MSWVTEASPVREQIAEQIWIRHYTASTEQTYPDWRLAVSPEAHEKARWGHPNIFLGINPDVITGAVKYCRDTADCILAIMFNQPDA